METVLEEALNGFVRDVLNADRPNPEFSLKIFFIFKNIVANHDHVEEEKILSIVQSRLLSLPDIKEQLSASADDSAKCILVLRGQILMRLFFIWVARGCLNKDIENDPELKNVTDEIIKLCEMFCIRTCPLQLTAFLSETAMKMFIDHVPDILVAIFEEFLLPVPKELSIAAGSDDNDLRSPASSNRSPMDSKEPSFDDWSSRRRSSREGKNVQPRRLILSPIKVDENSRNNSASLRFGKRPSRQILVASRSTNEINPKTSKSRSKTVVMAVGAGIGTKPLNSSDRRSLMMKSQSFDHIGASLRQKENVNKASSQLPTGPQVRRCLFGDEAKSTQKPALAKPPGHTTPRKRSAAVLASVADTPPMDRAKQSRLAPMTPLSKLGNTNENENRKIPEVPKSPFNMFSKPENATFRIPTTPLRQLNGQQYLGAKSPIILVPQSPDDSKAGIAARSFYAKTNGTTPQAVAQATKRNILGSSSRRTMSSYDFTSNTPNVHSSESTHFLFAELISMSPTTGYKESSVIYGSRAPMPELYMSPRTCRTNPSLMSPHSSQKKQTFGSPIIESSRRLQHQNSLQQSPFSVAAGYACE